MKETDQFPLPPEMADLGSSAVALYSDGACRGNPGPGAWGIMAQNARGEVLFEDAGLEEMTTNNRMELKGAIEVLKRCRAYQKAPVKLFSDSKYVVDGMSRWIAGWKRRNWRKADGKVPENIDLWKELDLEASRYMGLEFLWVKGHSNHPQNDHCDLLANQALDKA